MTGRETGANARPAIKTIASSRRMAKLRFTDLSSLTLALIEIDALTRQEFHVPGIDQRQAGRPCSGAAYLSTRPITVISSDIFAR
jgi:hypothetical protein